MVCILAWLSPFAFPGIVALDTSLFLNDLRPVYVNYNFRAHTLTPHRLCLPHSDLSL